MPSPNRSWIPRKPTPCKGVSTPEAKGLVLVRSTYGEICHQIKAMQHPEQFVHWSIILLYLTQVRCKASSALRISKENKITLLSMSRSRRSFTVQPAPLRRTAPHPKSASIFKSGNSPGVAAIVIDLWSKGLIDYSTQRVKHPIDLIMYKNSILKQCPSSLEALRHGTAPQWSLLPFSWICS